MKMPIVASCQGDFAVFNSPEAAALEMEPFDVDAGSWSAYDSDGRKLELRLVAPKGFFKAFFGNERVEIIDADPGSPSCRSELERELTSFLVEAGKIANDDGPKGLDDLIRLLSSYRKAK